MRKRPSLLAGTLGKAGLIFRIALAIVWMNNRLYARMRPNGCRVSEEIPYSNKQLLLIKAPFPKKRINIIILFIDC